VHRRFNINGLLLFEGGQAGGWFVDKVKDHSARWVATWLSNQGGFD
jgi:hypothetical protein